MRREDQTFIGQLFQPKATKPCTRARSFLAANSVAYTVWPSTGEMKLIVGQTMLDGFDEPALRQLLIDRGTPTSADPARVPTDDYMRLFLSRTELALVRLPF